MSTVNQVSNTGNFAITQYDFSKIFIGHNRYEKVNYTNGGGAPVNLGMGLLMGKIGASQLLLPLASAASDGSQFPFGVLADNYTVAAGATVALYVCVAGDVDLNKLVLSGADTLATLVSARSIRDRIASDTLGIKLVATTEMNAADNQ